MTSPDHRPLTTAGGGRSDIEDSDDEFDLEWSEQSWGIDICDGMTPKIITDIDPREYGFDPDEEQHRNADVFEVRIKSIRGHSDRVKSCQFVQNDTRLLTASYDKTIILWDFATGVNLQSYEGHTHYVNQARACEDGSRIVSAGWDKKLHMWDAETGQIIWSGNHTGIVTCCCFSHDGKYVASGSDLDFAIRVWDAESGQVVQCIKGHHQSTPTSCNFNTKDDRIISTGMDQTSKFWDLKSRKSTLSLRGHVNVISGASCSSDERKLATVSWDKSIAIWDISTGMFRSQGPGKIEKAHEGSISSCKFSEDGSTLVTGGYDQTVALWDVENMVQKLRLQGHTDWVEDVCYSKDQKWLLSCSKDKTVRLWNVEESDNIPLVLENRKSIGLKMFKCASCGKPFSMSQIESSKDANLCVFCRLQTPDRNIPIIEA